MTTSLFQPITLDGLAFPNRIAVAPMCQYSADDGSASDWHLYHWMNLAMSGAGMVTVEMTDVERRGRISHGCLGLYSDDNEAAARRALDAAKRVAAPGTKFGTQLA
ncbi:MAG: oxidoreductase, partial [Mesorhizobium sp.]